MHASEANSGRHLLRGGLSAARVAYLDKLHHVRLLAPLMPLIQWSGGPKFSIYILHYLQVQDRASWQMSSNQLCHCI